MAVRAVRARAAWVKEPRGVEVRWAWWMATKDKAPEKYL